MASTTSSRSHEQQADCWNDWNSPASVHHHAASFTTPMRAMEGISLLFCFFFLPASIECNVVPACLLTAGGQEQHHFYRSEQHHQVSGPPVMMQETCDKTSVSPTPATNPINNSGLSPLGPVNNDPSVTVTKEERSSRQRGQSSPSPSKTFE